MTTDQIVDIIGEEYLTVRSYINAIKFIGFEKDKSMVFSEIQRTRFLFDPVNEILEVSFCRPYSKTGQIPSHNQYDIYEVNGENVVFEYLVDMDGNIIKDYYPFSAIMTINLREED